MRGQTLNKDCADLSDYYHADKTRLVAVCTSIRCTKNKKETGKIIKWKIPAEYEGPCPDCSNELIWKRIKK
jgi:hypothetical protein